MGMSMGMKVGPIVVGAKRAGEPKIKIEKHPLGWIVRVPPEADGNSGSILLDRVVALYKQAAKNGLNWADTSVAHMLRCEEAHSEPATGRVFFALTASHDSGVKWRAEIEARMDPALTPVQRWLRGPDYGESSANLVWLLTGERAPGGAFRGTVTQAYPCDADDFGRCLTLLAACPALRVELPGLASRYGWGPIVVLWPTLEAAMARGDRARVTGVLEGLRCARTHRPEVVMQMDGGGTATFPLDLLRHALPGLSDDAAIAVLERAALAPGGPDVTVRRHGPGY